MVDTRYAVIAPRHREAYEVAMHSVASELFVTLRKRRTKR
jgi:hypothetical protein